VIVLSYCQSVGKGGINERKMLTQLGQGAMGKYACTEKKTP
jgi:hypothetical protein